MNDSQSVKVIFEHAYEGFCNSFQGIIEFIEMLGKCFQEKRCYYSSRRYYENEGYEIVTPTFLLDKYGKYKIVNKEVQSDE